MQNSNLAERLTYDEMLELMSYGEDTLIGSVNDITWRQLFRNILGAIYLKAKGE